jgi:hypothetical protein
MGGGGLAPHKFHMHMYGEELSRELLKLIFFGRGRARKLAYKYCITCASKKRAFILKEGNNGPCHVSGIFFTLKGEKFTFSNNL